MTVDKVHRNILYVFMNVVIKYYHTLNTMNLTHCSTAADAYFP